MSLLVARTCCWRGCCVVMQRLPLQASLLLAWAPLLPLLLGQRMRRLAELRWPCTFCLPVLQPEA